jgi:hypothetical protein
MNGTDIKKAAINKAKQVAQAANGSGGKKRRKGQDLKPIITTEEQASQNASPASTGSFHYKYVLRISPSTPTHNSPPHCACCTLARITTLIAVYTHGSRTHSPPTPVLTRNPAVSKVPPHPSTSTKCTATN